LLYNDSRLAQEFIQTRERWKTDSDLLRVKGRFGDWKVEKIYKIVLEKPFFFILWRFYRFLVLVWKNLKNGPSERTFFFLEIGHIGYKKN
jgi:hypothetical protein